MTALVIDTATERGVIALFSGKKILVQQELEIGFSNSRSLLPALDALCDKVAIPPTTLSYIAVGHGPGSYTGIRVGVSCAKALSFALKIPLVGITGLRGFVPEEGFSGTFFGCIDAKIGGVYLIKGKVVKNEVIFLTEESLIPFDLFVKRLGEADCLVTPRRTALESRLDKDLARLPLIIERGPSVDLLIREAEQKMANKEYSLDGSLPLLYLRRTQAEIERGD